MSDLRGFSALADGLDPQDVVLLLNGYLEAMTAVILKWGGTIDEFLGDAILVLFGAPVARPDDPVRAAACALEMQQEMTAVNARSQERGLPEVEMGIESYTVGGQVLISASTRAALGPLAELGATLDVQPKAMRAVTIHELVGLGGSFGIRLERRVRDRLALTPELPCRFVVVEGKDARGRERSGWIVSITPDMTEAEIRAEEGVRPFTNLRLLAGESPGPEAYAKVLPVEACMGSFVVRFTSLPGQMRQLPSARLG